MALKEGKTMQDKELNELVKQIEVAYRNDNKKWNIRLTQINPEYVREVMLEHKIGLQCDKCLKKKYGRYCCKEHGKYYREITDCFYGKNYPIVIATYPRTKQGFTKDIKVECVSCKKKQGWYSMSIDHIKPITKGGLEFDRENMQFMHLPCNIRKYNHTEEEIAEKARVAKMQQKLPSFPPYTKVQGFHEES